MRKFFTMMACGAVFFIGLGGIMRETGARVKSDERALDIMRLARAAIGGDENINGVRSMTITGKSTHVIDTGKETMTFVADIEANLELPGKLVKIAKAQQGNGPGAPINIEQKEVNVVVMKQGEASRGIFKTDTGEEIKLDESDVVVLKKDGGKGEEIKVKGAPGPGKRVAVEKDVRVSRGEMHNTELLRTTLSLLLSPPQGIEASYLFSGESSVDGTQCNVIDVQAAGKTIKLFLGKESNRLVMMQWTGSKMPGMIRINKEEMKAHGNKEVMIFSNKAEISETTEFQVKFSDFRNVGGLQFPHRWVQTAGGKEDEIMDVQNFEINPANIADKFKGQNIKVTTKKAN